MNCLAHSDRDFRNKRKGSFTLPFLLQQSRLSSAGHAERVNDRTYQYLLRGIEAY